MYEILRKRWCSQAVCELVVRAPLIAQSRRAGHFVIVRVDKSGERIPLTISNADINEGSITLVVQQVGVSTAKLCALNIGDNLMDVVGPLGQATHIDYFGTVVCACGGVGAAPMLPIAQALKQKGNRVITVLAARNKELILLHDELSQTSDEVIVMTDDGSMGQQGLVTAGVEQVIARERVDRCITIGPAIMMKFVAATTAKYNVYTEASLNTIMVDGTGMCGACRVTVGGKTRFVCVDGPEFDAHAVDWDEMLSRLRSYRAEETEAYQAYQDANASLTPKQRMAIERVVMPELSPEERAQSLHKEVNLGLTPQQALTESHRCLSCKNPGCVSACPVNIDIPAFIKQIENGDIDAASDIIHLSSSLPAVCGRVCPQEKQCESACIHLKAGRQPVAIGYLERFVADHATNHSHDSKPVCTQNDNITKIAVVGSGPAGLTFAGDMAKYGYKVTVFEALHQIGGVLKYGIPEYRLPNAIVDKEIDGLRQLGVEFVTDVIIGKTLTIEQLREQGYNGIFVASGAGLPKFMSIPGENLNGVLSANEYLTRVNLMDASANGDTPVLFGRNVLVIGGGNTAMDAVRTAKRLGAEHATIVYRRSETEMPARIEEVKHAKAEGIEFLTLHNPLEYHADSNNRVAEAVLQVMELSEPDASGRRSPVPIEGQTRTMSCDLVIVAVGVSPNPIVPRSLPNLEMSKRGTIVVDDNMRSSMPILYAGGDIVRGGATVILAMADGRKAAAAMHDALSTR